MQCVIQHGSYSRPGQLWFGSYDAIPMTHFLFLIICSWRLYRKVSSFISRSKGRSEVLTCNNSKFTCRTDRPDPINRIVPAFLIDWCSRSYLILVSWSELFSHHATETSLKFLQVYLIKTAGEKKSISVWCQRRYLVTLSIRRSRSGCGEIWRKSSYK